MTDEERDRIRARLMDVRPETSSSPGYGWLKPVLAVGVGLLVVTVAWNWAIRERTAAPVPKATRVGNAPERAQTDRQEIQQVRFVDERRDTDHLVAESRSEAVEIVFGRRREMGTVNARGVLALTLGLAFAAVIASAQDWARPGFEFARPDGFHVVLLRARNTPGPIPTDLPTGVAKALNANLRDEFQRKRGIWR